MSHAIFCYKSLVGKPIKEEALLLIKLHLETLGHCEKNVPMQHRIVRALETINPSLETIQLNHEAIAVQQSITLEEAEYLYDHIDLNTPPHETPVSLSILHHMVSIRVGNWPKGAASDKLIIDLGRYIKAIREVAGYFVYDPQLDTVFDPAENNFQRLKLYMAEEDPLTRLIDAPKDKKPWYKFW
ncbi:hypothetical protein LX64_00329 [Chitinophaga skermanii]|uniref:Uncharacterized protein n=1 Tax=Chitinophaga skermanii TaxID=331697 RepID=A0A327R4R8_9BACT|nr:hypothetical protein [Chitinophaga skermanii]RAJ10723.1 hypothetical protein LX64_00329 [Chitinophaga skermanii]